MHCAIILLACSAALGLAADGPQFEVASVKPAAPPSPGAGTFMGSRGGPGTPDPAQVTYTNFTLKDLLVNAYHVANYQISGLGWLDTERYDVAAKIPPDTTWEQFALMLQSLLAERFKVTLHHEMKDLPLYELVVAKNGPKLKPWVEDPNGPAQSSTAMTVRKGRYRMVASKQSVEKLVGWLAIQLGHPVVDKTGLTGEYDYTLEYSPNPADPDAPSLPTAVQEQLGLRLEQKKAPLDLLIIDRADRVPTEN
jgi:uncharacterized protein (TIGR03435 family)